MDGEVFYEIDDQRVTLAPGILTVINPETLHVCNFESGSRSFLMVYLDIQWCLKIQQSLWQNTSFVPVDCVTVKDRVLNKLFLDAMDCLMGRFHLIDKEQFLMTLGETVFARCCPPSVPEDSSPQYIEELKGFLAENLIEDVIIEQFASQHGLNSYTLLRHFRKAIGITPHGYRLNCKIDHARELLRQGVDPGDTAQRCGFFDQSHMHRTLKAMTAVTPGQYQKIFS